MNHKHMLSIGTIVLIVGAIAFYGGIHYANASKGTSGNPPFQGQRFQAGQGNRRMGAGQGGGALNGEILSVDDQSVTVKLNNGGSKIAFYSVSTQISKTVEGTAADLKSGENLMIIGEDNPDGSMTAKTIQLRNRPLVDPNAKTTPQATAPGTTK